MRITRNIGVDGNWRVPIVIAIAWAVLFGNGAVALAQQRVLGIDVSAWQGSISTSNWNTLHNTNGRDFVFIRSSRGGTTGYYDQNNSDNDPPTNTLSQRYDDPYFVQNINRATTAGMLAGSYHFSRPDVIESTLNSGGIANSGADEADHFIQMAGAWMRPGYLLPVHDLEAGDGIRSDNEMAQFTLDFSNRIYEVMGIRPAIYLSGNYAHFVLGGASLSLRTEVVEKHPVLWSARYANQGDPDSIPVQTGDPSETYANLYGPWDDPPNPAQPWSFWQYASTARLSGYKNGTANIDVDVANGGVEFLKDNLVPALWMDDVSGDWSTLSNWNSGQNPIAPVQGPGQVPRVGTLTLPTPRLPGAAGSGVTSGQHDTVILDRPNADVTVTLSTGTHNIRKLYVREALNITGGSLNVNYEPSADSTPISAQFSAPVMLDGGSVSVHTLQVDVEQQFTLHGGALTFNTIALMPQNVGAAQLMLAGNVPLNALGGVTANISNGTGAGRTGIVNLGGENREVNVTNGAAAIDVAINVPVVDGGLTKVGAGTLALNASNTYAGDTAVQAGRLKLGVATLEDTADVRLSTGGLLELDFAGGPDVINALFIDGISQATGTWGATGSGAQFTSDLLAGTGLLQVTTFVPPPLSGDYNEDGVVDAADYVVWRDNLGSETALPNDDTIGVGPDDYERWKAHFGETNLGGAGSAASSGVPEPQSACLLSIAFAMLQFAWRLALDTTTFFSLSENRRADNSIPALFR